MTETADLVFKASELYGDQLALIDGDSKLSFNQLDQQVGCLSDILSNFGVSENSRVGLYASNSIEYIVSLLALLRIKAVACPMSARYLKVMIDKIALHTGQSFIISDQPIEIRNCSYISIRKLAAELKSKDYISKSGSTVNLNQLATIMFTSGSSSTPKAVCHSLGNHYYNAIGANLNIPFEPGDRWLLSLPLYHVGGMGVVFRSLVSGGTIVLQDKSKSIYQQLISNAITHLSLVNTQLRDLIESISKNESELNLKAVIIGGGPQNETLLNDATQAGLPIARTYGMTEMGSQVTCSKVSNDFIQTADSGKLLKHREMKISDSGEILLRGECLMQGYLDSENKINTIETDSWFHTGDLGQLDEYGNLKVIGRLDNMFISGGENIHPEQIEEVLLRISGIKQVMVVPVPDEKYGFRPVAFVNCAPRPIINLGQLADNLSDKLPSYMIPIRFFPWPQSLVSFGLKPSRFRLKKYAVEMLQAEG